ncbi:MAG: TIGR02186 family protein [Deltaproteobacteria bacterium]|nr:TIGR02186 family protein [Deltaproteobacteria bacterium]
MKRILFVFLLPFFLWVSSWVAWGFTGEIHIQPSSFARALFVEKSSPLTLRGPAPEGSQIIIKVVGPDRDFKLNKSGRVFGFLWMPVSHGVVRTLPGMYALLSSVKVAEALSPEEQRAVKLFPDFKELLQQGRVSFQEERVPEEAETLSRDFLRGLIRILQEKGLYQQEEKAVQIAGGQFQAILLLPAEAPLGEYRVSAYALEGGKARLLAIGRFTAKTEGLAAWLARQAQDNPSVYGIIAVLIALGAGAFVGVIFQLGRRS